METRLINYQPGVEGKTKMLGIDDKWVADLFNKTNQMQVADFMLQAPSKDLPGTVDYTFQLNEFCRAVYDLVGEMTHEQAVVVGMMIEAQGQRLIHEFYQTINALAAVSGGKVQ